VKSKLHFEKAKKAVFTKHLERLELERNIGRDKN
jgi:hypothetical protein